MQKLNERGTHNMPNTLNITAAGNTYNPCLIVLKDKGYELYADCSENDTTVWYAKKPGLRLSGFSPPELLGIVILAETFGDDWNQQEPNVIREIPRC
ncbi:hypothetical protein Plim_1045 [Planctopirus limnophila DSM 3776]|uniref:Uncharacterized protein n=1 Tax=Planctopirus limnophila (strain ATCC 43296 / DSM 3776 / IFAM 1008 / Mu 290) TaxID=521674 RepID=D5STB7_PLAL2|nr:hypothetical protein Plim_1045 [Planctopirus limnophila DSM 3776]